MSLPDRHANNCNKCGGAMWLRTRKDGSGQFYSCANWKPVDQGGKGCKNIYNVEEQPTGATAQRPSKMICAHCGGENNIMITSLAVGKPKQQTAKIETTHETPKDDLPF